MAFLICAVLAPASAVAQSKNPAPPEIIGKIELAPGVPCATCLVVLPGTPSGGYTDANGNFAIQRLPPGHWDLKVTAKDLPDPHFITPAALNAGVVTDVGVLRPWKPGSIAGRVELPGSFMMADAVVELPIQGLSVKPNADGTFLLPGVAPGKREIQVTTAQRRLHKRVTVTVQPGQTARVTVKIDDPAATVVTPGSSVPTDRVNKVPVPPPVKPVR